MTTERGDVERRSLQIGVSAPLTEGRMHTGAINWGHFGIDVHAKHVRELAMLADAGTRSKKARWIQGHRCSA